MQGGASYGMCTSGKCSECGGDGQRCCPAAMGGFNTPGVCGGADVVCVTDFVQGNMCRKCGGAMQPCCPGNSCSGACCNGSDQCVAMGASCGSPGMGGDMCAAGSSCGTCGGVGQPCCGFFGNQWCSASLTACSSDMCVVCGGSGERCCDNSFCTGGLTCGSGTCR